MKSTLGEGVVVPDLAAIAHERAALTTIADAIVAASVGKGLRVAVACPNSHLALVDYLAQALHARGRACRWLPMTPDPDDARSVPSDRQETDSTVVVIASGLDTEVGRGIRLLNISVIAGAQRVARSATGNWARRLRGQPVTRTSSSNTATRTGP
ncbi:hypothetical protein AB0873_28085 [Micromonospora sp. NPDC047707]|uniref:hypothetical protein n=1 Tax=Micromonospora sp. NPDC047707 TaxID=3154498 RepID=UPI003456AE46